MTTTLVDVGARDFITVDGNAMDGQWIRDRWWIAASPALVGYLEARIAAAVKQAADRKAIREAREFLNRLIDETGITPRYDEKYLPPRPPPRQPKTLRRKKHEAMGVNYWNVEGTIIPFPGETFEECDARLAREVVLQRMQTELNDV